MDRGMNNVESRDETSSNSRAHIKEGTVNKGGRNPRPTSARPNVTPKPQKLPASGNKEPQASGSK